jgi:hypothetical protein
VWRSESGFRPTVEIGARGISQAVSEVGWLRYSYRMEQCWAKSLGDCEGTISEEHYVSSGVFSGGEIYVHGLAWCKGVAKKIAKKRLVRSMLCVRHNGRLSPLDMEATKAFRIVREYVRLSDVRNQMNPRSTWNIVRRKLDGPLLERWFLKTLVNCAFGGERRIGKGARDIGLPSDELVKVAYGIERFKNRAGLHLLSSTGHTLGLEERFEYLPMSQPDHLSGALFLFYGFYFVLYLEEEGLDLTKDILIPGPLPSGAMATGGVNAKPIFHPSALKFNVHEKLSHALEIRWDCAA